MNYQLDEKQIRYLITKYGSPLYVFHSEGFEENYKKLLETMRLYYSNYNIAYSYKTNYTPKICNYIKGFGGYAEVVSSMEYELAKKIGYSDKLIVYNGPYKGNGLFEHIKEGGLTNVDSIDELNTIIEYAKLNKDIEIQLLYRVNIDIGQNFISRFGIDSYTNDKTSSELDEAFELVSKISNINVVGFHCHIGKSRSIEAWKKRIDVIFELIDHYFTKMPKVIDLGSGMNSVMEPFLAKQFGEYIPSFDDYAKVIANAMNDKYGFLPIEKRPLLLTEPGTTLVSGFVSLLSSVKTIKKVKGINFVTLDCSDGNIGEICHIKRLPMSIYYNGGKKRRLTNAYFAGYTCIEKDIVYEGYTGDLAIGDIVQFRNIGSYSNVLKPPFILPNCAMIEINRNGDTELIKRAETFDDIFRTYVF